LDSKHLSGVTVRRVLLTLADQVVSSVSNFAPGVVIARSSGAAEFGNYMLTFLVWVIIVGFHRALLTEPLIVTSRKAGSRSTHIGEGVIAELGLATSMSALVAGGGLLALQVDTGLGGLLLALSPWFIPLLLQDYWRAMAFRERRPGLALVNDFVFASVQAAVIVAFVVLGWDGPVYIVMAWGMGAMAGAVLGFCWFPSIASPREGWRLLRRLWPLSRWLLADFSTSFASQQAYLALAAGLLVRAEYGGFRAALSLMGPTIVILHAGANVALPEASRLVDPEDSASLRQLGRRMSAATALSIGAYGVVVTLTGDRLLTLLYGPEFARFHLLAMLAALQYTLSALRFGQEVVVKAAGRMRRFWRARALVAGASLISLVVLVRWLGTPGAGWAGVATGAYYAAAVSAVYRLELPPSTSGQRGESVPIPVERTDRVPPPGAGETNPV
jgi:O-antigen/teichoic acid export membrane protein